MRSTILVCLFALLLNGLAAQPINIGEKCPDSLYKDVLNIPGGELKLSAYYGKWVILDFWGTGCIGCIRAFPDMDRLQKKFGDKIQIIMVNKESRDSTLRFFAKRKQLQMPSLPIITGDSLLSNFFPHGLLPHHVWLNPMGQVLAATFADNASDETIELLLNGKQVAFSEKKDRMGAIDWNKPLLTLIDSTTLAQVEAWSYLMPAIENISGTETLESRNESLLPNRLYANRFSALGLIRLAWEQRKFNFGPRNCVLLEINDTSRLLRSNYAYDLLVPSSKADQVFNRMQQDMIRYFDVNPSIEKRNIMCWVLVRTGKKDKLRSRGGTSFESYRKSPTDSVWQISNKPFIFFLLKLKSQINDRLLNAPFIDATGYKGNIDICMNAAMIDWYLPVNIALIRKELKKYGLDLVQKKWSTDVLVIRDKK